MSDILQLKEQLASLRLQKKSLKQQIKQKKKKEKIIANKMFVSDSPSTLEKIEVFFDDRFLSVYESLGKRAEEIQFKRANPELYKAQCAIRDITKLTEYFEKKVARSKKPLSSKQTDVLVRLDTALSMIQHIVKTEEEKQQVFDLSNRIKALLPENLREILFAIDTAVPHELMSLMNQLVLNQKSEVTP